jgi:hypothetical protein
MNPEERPNLEDYKSKDKATGKKLILLRLLLFQHQKEMCKQKDLEIPLEDNKENIKSETKPPQG